MQNADGAWSFREPLGQTKVMQIRQEETLTHQEAITHEVCCLAAQLDKTAIFVKSFEILELNDCTFAPADKEFLRLGFRFDWFVVSRVSMYIFYKNGFEVI